VGAFALGNSLDVGGERFGIAPLETFIALPQSRSCVSVLRPDLSPKEKEKLAKKVLKLAARKGKLAITPAATEEIVMSNLQCISKNCPMLLFSEPLSRAINLYFGEE